MKNENYITIQGWMINEIKLSGNELILYALIYGFSQDGKSRFKGSMQYLADSLGITKKSVLEVLKKLVKKNYIKKYKSGPRGHEKCDYGVNSEKIKKFCGNETTPQNSLRLRNYTASGNETTPPSGNETTHHINIHTDLDNNIRGGSNEPPPTECKKSALELSELILTLHRKEYPDFLSGKTDGEIKKKINGWADDIEKLIRIDKKSPEIIKQVILWVKTPGEFWFHNIESGKKLRLQFERLYGQMVDEQKKQTSPPRHKIAADNMPTEDVSKYFKEAI